MKQEVRIAFAAAGAAKAAAQAAVAATNLLYHDPSAWAFADEAYWLCHTAAKAAEAADRYDVPGDYVAGANIAGFEKVANAMLAQGV